MSKLSVNSVLEVVIEPLSHDLGDNFVVQRILPSRQKRMVGPFVFLDQMGPHSFHAGHGLDVRPHPHIGLATLTYLFSGEILHRDSLGSVQAIRPGDVNWMTAGRGIVHSERSTPEMRQLGSTLFGLQCWVALPTEHEECEPAFLHTGAAELPLVEADGVEARVIIGSFLGSRSPVPTLSEVIFVDLILQPGAQFHLPADYAEQAIYLVEGKLNLGDDGLFDAGQLLVLKPGRRVMIVAEGANPVRMILLGGDPTDGQRYLAWNFVASSMERIEQARKDWREQKFPKVAGETEFIPLPDNVGKSAQTSQQEK